MQFQDEDIKKLAALSRLKLTQHDVEKFRDQLTSILQYVDQVTHVSLKGDSSDTDDTKSALDVMRADIAKQSNVSKKELLDASATHEEGYVSVHGMR